MSKPVLSTLSRNRLLVPLKRSFSANVWSRHLDVDWPSATSTLSGSFSFASPESDFTARSNPQVHLQESDNEWSHDMSFASPESDFSSRDTTQVHVQEKVSGLPPTHLWSNQLSFTSPESDFSAQWKTERRSAYPTNDDLPLFINHPETAYGSILRSEIVDEQLLKDLQQDKQEQEEPLPASLEEIYVNPQDPRAIVVTSTQEPFSIVHVNDAWVGLCGYSREESRNHSLAQLLQGPETNKDKLHEFMRLLREGQQASTVITNYTKEGRMFRNRVRAAPLRKRGEITHFVGVLQEIA